MRSPKRNVGGLSHLGCARGQQVRGNNVAFWPTPNGWDRDAREKKEKKKIVHYIFLMRSRIYREVDGLANVDWVRG